MIAAESGASRGSDESRNQVLRWATGEQPIIYTRDRLTGEIGQYYYRHRMYHAQLGRFVSRDPVGYRNGAILYSYVELRPTVLVDPSGLQPPKKLPTIPALKSPPKDVNWYPPKLELPPGDWDMPSDAPDDWYSALCRDACEEARKTVDTEQDKAKKGQTDLKGQVWCVKDPKTNLMYACPCVYNIRLETGEEFKWNECPPITWCTYRHEVGHIETGQTMCRNTKLCPGEQRGEDVEKYHKDQCKRDKACITQAFSEIIQWPEGPKKEKCIRLADDLLTKDYDCP